MKKILSVENLKAYYDVKVFGIERTVKAVDNISFDVYEDEILGLAGESGCGKSTLIKVLYGILKPPLDIKSGKVLYHLNQPIDILTMDIEDKREKLYWKVVSYIPQGSMNVLNPLLRIKKQFMNILKVHHKEKAKEDLEEMVVEHIKNLGLPREVLNSYPHQLSGGMRQRVTIALATVLTPRIIFADEPTTALDVVVQRGVLQLLKDLQKMYRNTIIMVTHDIAVHAELTDRLAVMYAGKIVELSSTREIFKNPLHPYTKFLINSVPQIGEKTIKNSAPGSPPSLANPPTGCRFHPRCPLAMRVCSEKDPPFKEIFPGHFVACFRVEGDEKDD